MKVNITPFPITQTATSLSIRIINTDENNATIYYELLRDDGKLAENGNQVIPIEALAILAQKPLSIEALNGLLAGWGIEATSVYTEPIIEE